MSKINFETDAVTQIDQANLKSVAQLLQDQLKLERNIEIIEETLKLKKQNLYKLSGEIIPQKMAELGLTATEMSDGSKVKIMEDIHVSIPKDPDKSTACYQWLTDNGLGDIIKNQVGIATFKKWHEEGRSVPDNTFNLFIGQKTKITRKT